MQSNVVKDTEKVICAAMVVRFYFSILFAGCNAIRYITR